MISTSKKTNLSFAEFVILLSLLMSLTALSIDAILPALAQIGSDLQVQNANDRQLVVSMIFLGLACGQLFFGPLSDSTGRKTAIYAGLGLYLGGTVLSMLAISFPLLLLGRLMQGIGVSAPRAVSVALVRDQYEGRAMARVMSFVMTVFILVPMIAPAFGQAILLFTGWRAIFGSYLLLAAGIMIWFALRMPETLALENRVPLSWRHIMLTMRGVVTVRPALGYTVTAGLVSGVLIGYLNSSQQIFQEQYELGERFPLYFAILSSAVGLASLLNTRLVMRFGMRLLVRTSLSSILGLSIVFLGFAVWAAGTPSLWSLMVYLMICFFCIGILFGNLNSLAMAPLGHIAGTGAAVVGALSTLISVLLGTLIGQSYNDTILPLVAGMVILSGLSLTAVHWAELPQ
ncbi:MAG TPA: multidrug effflux MFS transporter [Chloroflexota bacterium]|nr:multidrug effflux MFS transporter [Chloroflexota bacterium]HUM70796.1 multidrug effflux MFS transporter [Chloroflexota bacterium]